MERPTGLELVEEIITALITVNRRISRNIPPNYYLFSVAIVHTTAARTLIEIPHDRGFSLTISRGFLEDRSSPGADYQRKTAPSPSSPTAAREVLSRAAAATGNSVGEQEQDRRLRPREQSGELRAETELRR